MILGAEHGGGQVSSQIALRIYMDAMDGTKKSRTCCDVHVSGFALCSSSMKGEILNYSCLSVNHVNP